MFILLAGHGKSAGCLLSGQTPKLICGKYARGLVLNLRTQNFDESKECIVTIKISYASPRMYN